MISKVKIKVTKFWIYYFNLKEKSWSEYIIKEDLYILSIFLPQRERVDQKLLIISTTTKIVYDKIGHHRQIDDKNDFV